MARELEVRLFAERVGILALIDGRLSFRYAQDWLSRPGAVTLSRSLPLQAEPFDDRHTRPFFAGLLPEGQLRRLIAQQFQVSSQNDFALLDHIGGECAGAVTLLEPGQPLSSPGQGDEVQWLCDEEIVAILTGHVLKDPDYTVNYHRGTLRYTDRDGKTIEIQSNYANSFTQVPADRDAILAALNL